MPKENEKSLSEKIEEYREKYPKSMEYLEKSGMEDEVKASIIQEFEEGSPDDILLSVMMAASYAALLETFGDLLGAAAGRAPVPEKNKA